MTCPLPHRQPAEPDPGYLICPRHLARLKAHLTSIAEICQDLDDLLIAAAPVDTNDHRSARCDPAAPCRLDILDLLDKRSDTPALHLVQSWCVLVQDERHLAWMPDRPVSQALFLIRHLDWLGHHPAAPDCATEIANANRWLTQAAGLGPPPPLFMCPVIHPGTEEECGGPVRPERWTFGVVCAKCGQRWSGDEQLRRLGLVEQS